MITPFWDSRKTPEVGVSGEVGDRYDTCLHDLVDVLHLADVAHGFTHPIKSGSKGHIFIYFYIYIYIHIYIFYMYIYRDYIFFVYIKYILA